MQVKYYYKDETVFEGESRDAPHRTDPSKVLHREDGPAAEFSDGYKEWYLNGLLHRENGPAIEDVNDGTKAWYQNGKLHREDGPAVEWCDGDVQWFLNGKELNILSKKYLIRYMELTAECLASLLLSPDEVLRESTKKYKWKELKI